MATTIATTIDELETRVIKLERYLGLDRRAEEPKQTSSDALRRQVSEAACDACLLLDSGADRMHVIYTAMLALAESVEENTRLEVTPAPPNTGA